MNSKRVLITGGAGYIGSHVAHLLSELGHEITILDSLYSGFRWAIPSTAQFVEGEVGNRDLVTNVLREQKIEAVLHFAAHIEVEESMQNPLKYYRNNTQGTLSLLHACSDAEVRKVIFSSTAAVYGEPRESVVTEESELNPINPYGRSKLMSERMLADVAATGAFRYVALRYFNVAGAKPTLEIGQATPNATHLIKVAAQAALGIRKKMYIMGQDYPTKDGTCVRDYIHVCDLAKAHADALAYLDREGVSDVFNVGYGHGYSVREVIRKMQEISGVDFEVEMAPRRAGDPALLIANSSKARLSLAWRPQFDDLAFICKTALDWERKLGKCALEPLRL